MAGALTRFSPCLQLLAQRVLTAVPVLFGVTLLTFVVLDVLPGNAASQLIGANASASQVARLEAALHLDQPAWQRYCRWLQNSASGDFGKSLASGQPVIEMLSERAHVTVELVVYAFVLSLGFAVPTALLAARKPDGIVDRAAAMLSAGGLSLAGYVLALILVLVFAVKLRWFSSFGFNELSAGLLANLRSLTLPAIAIGFPLFCAYTRFLRADLVEQMYGADYVATAVAKGISPWRVLIHHALRNSALGLITIVGLNFGALIGGTVVIEQIFSLPGIGQLLLQAVNTRDIALIQAIVLLLGLLTVVANLIVDLLYAALDPRIRYERR